jgi:hypothetical protein
MGTRRLPSALVLVLILVPAVPLWAGPRAAPLVLSGTVSEGSGSRASFREDQGLLTLEQPGPAADALRVELAETDGRAPASIEAPLLVTRGHPLDLGKLLRNRRGLIRVRVLAP